MEPANDPLRAAPAPVPDELFARIAVQKGLATLGSLRECLDILRGMDASERRPLSSVMLRQGVLSRQEVELLEKGVRAGSAEGRRIGRYELLADIGEGGMGTVHAAMDSSTLRFCALKILPKELAEAEDIVKRFLQEAETACTLRHPNIVGGLEVGNDNGVHFFSMEFVDGETVYDRLESETVLPEGECLRIAKGISLGLQYACEHGLVHRDMKPENIMIDRDGTPKLLDMGLVKRTDTARVTRLTQSGMAIGTPHYISPEQARGEEKVDTRSDIYALGATLYHMVTGQVPFEGNTAAVIMTKHLTEELDWPSDVKPDVSEHTSRLISRMMAKERVDRYARPKDVVADIDLILTGRAPSGDRLPPGVSSIRGAVSIARARDKADAKARTTSVYERIKRRTRAGWLLVVKDRVKAFLKARLQGRAKALLWAAGVLVALNLVVLVMYLAAEPGSAPDGNGEPASTGAPAAPDDPVIPGTVGVSPAQARLDAEAERRLKEILDRVRADPRLRDRALE
ncbi:MAG: serine/threonine-protein kinase, partial [Planctomycetota bacterium]